VLRSCSVAPVGPNKTAQGNALGGGCGFGSCPAPKGPDKSAQGNALGTFAPTRDSLIFRALQGRNKWNSQTAAATVPTIVPPL
jgi:hypothetical protein